MLGLLLKDFYNVRKQAAWYAAMIVLFCVISVALGNTAFASTIGILVTVSIPITAIAYEEKDGWQKFVVASGTRARQPGDTLVLRRQFRKTGTTRDAAANGGITSEGGCGGGVAQCSVHRVGFHRNVYRNGERICTGAFDIERERK